MFLKWLTSPLYPRPRVHQYVLVLEGTVEIIESVPYLLHHDLVWVSSKMITVSGLRSHIHPQYSMSGLTWLFWGILCLVIKIWFYIQRGRQWAALGGSNNNTQTFAWNFPWNWKKVFGDFRNTSRQDFNTFKRKNHRRQRKFTDDAK